MYIYMTDQSGTQSCCFVPDAAWPSVRGAMNQAATANGMSFIAQTEVNNPSDVTATCATPAAASSWVAGLSGKFGYERGYFRCLRQPGRVQALDCESRCEFGEEVNSMGKFAGECRPSGTLGDYATWNQVMPYNLTPLRHRLCDVQFAGEDVTPDGVFRAPDYSQFGHAHGGHGGGGGRGGGGYYGGGVALVAEEIPDYSWVSEMRHGGVVSRG